MSQKRIPILRVKWEDSCSHGGWRSWKEHHEEDKPAVCESVGYQIGKNSRYILIGQNMSDNGDVNAAFSIPRKVVTSIEVIGYSPVLKAEKKR